jgi:hypothetical protein
MIFLSSPVIGRLAAEISLDCAALTLMLFASPSRDFFIRPEPPFYGRFRGSYSHPTGCPIAVTN